MPINQRLCILQCTAGYPATSELNLRVINQPSASGSRTWWSGGLARQRDCDGRGAFMLGARVVREALHAERAMKGTDHAFSWSGGAAPHGPRFYSAARGPRADGVKSNYPSERAP